jgi:hypothetical protein
MASLKEGRQQVAAAVVSLEQNLKKQDDQYVEYNSEER